MIRYDQLESAWIRNKSSNLSVKTHKTTASDPQRSSESHYSQTHKQGATPAKGRRETLATTPHHATCYVYIIDQARGQDGWILAEFSFCVFMD